MQCPGAEAAAGEPSPMFDSVVPHEVPIQTAQCLDYPFDIKAGESLGDRADRLLYHLADFTGARLSNDRSLPVDFKITLQVVEYMGQQAALLHEVNTKLEDIKSDFFEQMCSVREDLLADHEEISKHLQNVSSTLAESPRSTCLKDDRGGSIQDSGNCGMDRGRDSPMSPVQPLSPVVQEQGGDLNYCAEPSSLCIETCSHANRNQLQYEVEHFRIPERRKEHAKDPEEARLLGARAIEETVDSTEYPSSGKRRQSRSSGVSEEAKALGSKSQQSTTSQLKELPDDHWLKQFISHNYFEWACATVIITNAVTIGIQAQESVAWAVEHPGMPFTDNNKAIAVMNKIYISFYTVELALKLTALREMFFCGVNWRWNLFDFILVLTGIYDIVTEITPLNLGGGMNVTGLRVLRIVKTLKLLRVVKVMRFFQVLRQMVSSIAGSMTTLFWSILMISIMMYMFGLCFLQAVVGFLNDNKAKDIPPEVMEGIKDYWSSVEQAMMTLFWAVTGGADWEPLAEPIRRADSFFFSLFFFYIAFAAFAVLNVLTGMFVDTAMKVAQQDEEAVVDELISRPEVKAFKTSILHQMTPDGEELPGEEDGFITARLAGHDNRTPAMMNFQKLLEIDQEDCERIYQMLVDGENKEKINLDDFIQGCCHAKGSISGLDMQILMTETKHIKKLMLQLVHKTALTGAEN